MTIAGEHKRNLTRPKYSLALIGESYENLTMKSMRRVLKEGNEVCYVAYTVLMDADIQEHDITRIHTDGESVAITFQSAKLAKGVRDKCNKEEVRYGSRKYKAKLKVRDQYLIVETEKISQEDE